MGPWPGHHQVRVKTCSSWGLRLFWDMEDDSQDWPVAPHCGGLWLQSPPVGVRSWDRWQGKKVSAVAKTISCPILPSLWEGLNQTHDRVTWTSLKWCISTMGLKSFCLWCFKLGGNTETIATHLREVHYRLAIVCNVYWSFASMSAQLVLEHQSGCRTKLHKKSKLKRQEEAS